MALLCGSDIRFSYFRAPDIAPGTRICFSRTIHHQPDAGIAATWPLATRWQFYRLYDDVDIHYGLASDLPDQSSGPGFGNCFAAECSSGGSECSRQSAGYLVVTSTVEWGNYRRSFIDWHGIIHLHCVQRAVWRCSALWVLHGFFICRRIATRRDSRNQSFTCA